MNIGMSRDRIEYSSCWPCVHEEKLCPLCARRRHIG